MKFQNFKPYAKYGLSILFIISLVGTAYADTNQLMSYNWSGDTGNTTVDYLEHKSNSTTIQSIQNSNKSGGIALSWDDSGHIDTCYQYLPMFQKYNATCTINVNIVSNRPQTIINKLNALHSAGWEVALHGYNHVNSVQFLNDNNSTMWLDQEIFPNIVEVTRYGYPVYTLAYPYSSRNAATDAIVAPYFRTLRTRTPTVVNGNINETTLAYYKWDDTQLLYGVEIDDQSSGSSLESIENGIDYAIKTGSVLVLYGHAITPTATGPYQTSTSKLDSILNYTSQNGGVFYHMGDLGNSSWVQLPRFSNVTANYTVSTNSFFVGKNVTFVDYSINQTTELLDFGDGSPTSSTANVTHTYTTPGIYTANLTVTNDVCSDSMLQKLRLFNRQLRLLILPVIVQLDLGHSMSRSKIHQPDFQNPGHGISGMEIHQQPGIRYMNIRMVEITLLC